MPRIWSSTIETHRQAVRDAALDVTSALVAERGLRSVTMSQIAEETGIGRATLYKYFPDVESILRAWHEREIARHLEQLAEARDRAVGAEQRLRVVVETFATIAGGAHGQHDAELAALLHRDQQVIHAEHRVRQMFEAVLAEGAATGVVRTDVSPAELAVYCLHALSAARTATSMAAIQRLVDLTLRGLRPEA